MFVDVISYKIIEFEESIIGIILNLELNNFWFSKNEGQGDCSGRIPCSGSSDILSKHVEYFQIMM